MMKQTNDEETLRAFVVHPAAALLPELPASEFDELKTDIKGRGLIVPILKRGKVILDGLHRLRACRELGIEPRFVEYDGENEIGEIFLCNILRRHLTRDQRVAILAKLLGPKLSENAKLRMESGVTVKPTQGGRVDKLLATEAKVGTYKAREALTVRKHRPEILDEVIEGKMALKDAARQSRPSVLPKKKARSLQEEVRIRFRRFMNRFCVDKHREVKAILRELV
jgi:hypothetical protein